MAIKSIVLWVVLLCSLVKVECFRGMYCCHLQGAGEVKQGTSNKHAAYDKIWPESCPTQNQEWLRWWGLTWPGWSWAPHCARQKVTVLGKASSKLPELGLSLVFKDGLLSTEAVDTRSIPAVGGRLVPSDECVKTYHAVVVCSLCRMVIVL
jgi:hypothetical protein